MPARKADTSIAAPAPRAERRARAWSVRLPPLLVDSAHIAALSAFAIAAPIFDLLSKNAEFFAVRGSTGTEIVVFALAVVLVPLLVALLLEGLAGLAGEAPRRVLHLLFVGGLVTLFALRAVKKGYEPSARWLVLLTLAAGVLAMLLYRRVRAVRLLASVLVPAPALFLVVFLFFSPVEKLVFPQEARASLGAENAPNDVILLILDEFPITSLMDERREIDAVRYPNFGDLARHSTWFRNATGEHEGTHAAVPAILDGRFPKRGKFPKFADHPQNVFTLLGGHYRMNVWEDQTYLCPPDLCRRAGEREGSFAGRMDSLFEDVGIVYLHMVVPSSLEERLPDVATSWGHFRQAGEQGTRLVSRFRRFADSIPRPGTRPTLSLAHILLPHGTWMLLPSCRQYITPAYSPGLEQRNLRWGADRWLVAQAFQRHLLQVRCTDRLLGELLRRLREKGVYDNALLIVTADQGVSIAADQSRRSVDPANPTNLQDLAFVPLFVKRPGQRAGAAVDTHVRTMDITPTIADVLGIRIPWRVDGRSVFAEGHSERVDFLTSRGWTHTDAKALERRRDRTLKRQLTLFGSGRSGPSVYALGPHRELLGRPVAALCVTQAAAHASIDDDIGDLLRSFRPGSDTVPAQIMGSISGPGAAANRLIAVGVNGRIEAVSRTYGKGAAVRYSALFPESALHPGWNGVEIFWLRAGKRPTLENLGPDRARESVCDSQTATR